MLQSMTLKQRQSSQRKILLKHYNYLLDSNEQGEYRLKLAKSLYTLLGSLMCIPFVGYQLVNFYKPKGDQLVKRSRLRYSMFFQILLSVLNWRWS